MITSYDALPLEQYMKIDRILHTPAEEIDKQVQIVAILAGMTEDEVLHLPLADYASMAAQTAFLGTSCTPVQTNGGAVQVGALTLIPTKDFTKISTAQYVDFQTLAKDFPATMPELLSCFLVPAGKTYNTGYDIADVHKAVGSLSVPVAYGLIAFFLESFNRLIADSLTSLGKSKNPKAKKMKTEVEMLLQKIGAGLPI